MRVALLVPCFVDQLLPEVAKACVTVLRRLGYDVEVPAGQTCCGQPAYNAGHHDRARDVALHTLDVFEDSEAVIVPSGSCGAMIRHGFIDLLPGDKRATRLAERTYEFSEFLADVERVDDVGAAMNGAATFHDGCHGLRELGIKSAPRRLLKHVRGLELREMDHAETCCGFGGTFAVKFAQISSAMAQVKVDFIERTKVETVISNDPSCLLQIKGFAEQQGRPLRCLHTAEVLAMTETGS